MSCDSIREPIEITQGQDMTLEYPLTDEDTWNAINVTWWGIFLTVKLKKDMNTEDPNDDLALIKRAGSVTGWILTVDILSTDTEWMSPALQYVYNIVIKDNTGKKTPTIAADFIVSTNLTQRNV